MDRAESAKCDTHEYHTSSGRCRALLRRRHLKKLLEMCNQLLAESIARLYSTFPDVPRDAACGWLSMRLPGPVTCSTIKAHAMPLSHDVTTIVPVMVCALAAESSIHRVPIAGRADSPEAPCGQWPTSVSSPAVTRTCTIVGLQAESAYTRCPHRLLQNCRYALFGTYFIMLSSDDVDVLVRGTIYQEGLALPSLPRFGRMIRFPTVSSSSPWLGITVTDVRTSNTLGMGLKKAPCADRLPLLDVICVLRCIARYTVRSAPNDGPGRRSFEATNVIR
jgi:hypothetical protein